ncbi:MAG TPA: CapA family protein [Holophagaceae bacterium]|jgi:poly-gamma-glutamate capsule biosynthesis protein CapA/YwtB (metallophosphatase superfamily)|nr:CapA family protein [Holophagaceae bacterium]
MPQVTVVAIGDIMMHGDVKQAAAQGGFDSLWADLAPVWKSADVAFANLETPVAPTTGRPGRPYQFNAPAELPKALKDGGLQVLSTANNHAFDQGPEGIVETLQRLNGMGLITIGTGATKAEAEQTVYLERNGMKLAFLGFTDIFNNDLDGNPLKPWVRKLDLDAACAAVAEARKQADAVIVSVHWGIEDHHEPTARQQEAAAWLVAAGADLILGHHPHVLQPVAWVYAGGRKGLAAYSLGNFISNQNRIYRATDKPVMGDERDGLLLRVVLRKTPTSLEIVSEEGEPLWCENNWRERKGSRLIRAVRIADALNGTGADKALLRARAARIRDIVGPVVAPILPQVVSTGSPSGPVPAGSRP